MANLNPEIITEQQLQRFASPAALDEARRSMDALSVTRLKVDFRGRLEAVVKPAPPSTEPPAYVHITKRGDRFRADCNQHGRDTWCIHALILSLHHQGVKPIFKEKVAKPDPATHLEVRLIARFRKGHLELRLKSKGAYIANPKRFLQREYGALRLDSARATQLVELCEEEADSLIYSPEDSAEALTALGEVELYTSEGEAYVRKNAEMNLPTIRVQLKGQEIHWTAEPPFPQGVQLLSGWPGYIVLGHELHKVPNYLPNLHFLQDAASPLPLTYANLMPFAREKHGVVWETPKPIWCKDIDVPGIDLRVSGRDLEGRLGIWAQGLFFPVEDLEASPQILRAGNRLALLPERGNRLANLRDQASRARLPLRGNGTFFIREQQVVSFLESTAFPSDWQVTRKAADQFFGLIQSTIQTVWDKGNSLPQYRIGEELFSHEELFAGLLPSGTGARLSDGRTLQFDTTEVVKNRHILSGVARLHKDPARQAELVARVVHGQQGEDGPELSGPWVQLLRSYQAEGVRWMLGNLLRQEPALLADDMGLGKTIQTLSLLDTLRKEAPQLVVVPTSLLMNWQEETARFCPHRQVLQYYGSKRTKDPEALAKADLIFTSYGTLLRDQELLSKVPFQVVVLDEAQTIKNSASQTAEAVCSLNCEHRVALTGTPVENRLTELWSIFQFLAPDYLGLEEEIGSITQPGSAAFEALKAKVGPFLKRRRKQDVEKELPAKQEQVVVLPMEESQAQVYRQFLARARRAMDGEKANATALLTRLLRLRQVSCHPGLVDETMVAARSNKLEYLLEQLQEVVSSGHSVLVFSQFTKFLGLVRFALEEIEMPYLYLDGRTTDRQKLVHRFQEGEAPVFLISLKAGGVGLNLTRASYVYHLDPWWNPAVEAQATDRAHRIGQTRTVFSYKLISENTVEDRILKLQAKKRLLSEGLWQDAETLFAQLDRETLLALLE